MVAARLLLGVGWIGLVLGCGSEEAATGDAAAAATAAADARAPRADGPVSPADATPVDPVFTLIAIPDTQQETRAHPEHFTGRMEWLVAQREALDIRFVSQVGDLVDWDTKDHVQYENASTGLTVLDTAGMPYAIAIGNHDTAAVCPGGSACPGADTHANLRVTDTFNRYFPVARFGALAGVYEEGKIDNAFHTFSAGGLEWLVINLELWPRDPVITWAKEVADAHPHHNVVVVTHMHTDSSDAITGSNGGYGDNSPQVLFDRLLGAAPNVKLVFSGHVGLGGFLESAGADGHAVYQFRQCYHDTTTNPTRLLEIDTDAGTIKTSVYAPFTDATFDGTTQTITGVEWIR